MSTHHTKDATVSWKWGQGTAKGKVVEVHHNMVKKTIKGSEIVKHGTRDNPAYFIEQEDGSKVLKLHSEIDS